VFDLPLESIHPLAFKAAEATRCAQEQGKYWAMHDRLFANQRTLGDWSAHAEAIGLNREQFEACLGSDRHAEGIRSDMAMAQKIGASGTPSFILARTNPNDPTRVTGIAFLRGAQPYGAFKALVERALGTPE
jgi:predicted DsbA family dithiol-disulfide isomerase